MTTLLGTHQQGPEVSKMREDLEQYKNESEKVGYFHSYQYYTVDGWLGYLQEIMEKTSITHHHNFAPDGNSASGEKSPVVHNEQTRDSELLDEMAKASLKV